MNIQSCKVIVNADDFGMSSSVNRAIVICFHRGLISSTTIMANMPGFSEACQLAIANQLTTRIGIHLNLSEGQPLLPELRDNAALCDESGNFRRFRSRILSKADRAQIAAEVTAQIHRCREAGLPLTHADSHQHVHTEPMVFLAIRSVLKRHGIRRLRLSRNMDPLPFTSPKRIAKICFNRLISICGLGGTNYFGSVENFKQFRDAGRLQRFTFEILIHPSFNETGNLIDHVEDRPLIEPLSQIFRGFRLSGYPCDGCRPSELQRAA